ncbi:MAG: hypothetical protein PHZ24_13865 [Bacteroidales bacterium]|nr:hypothetical protein [Bacteroidales bacterium]
MWKTGIITWKPFVNKVGEIRPEYGDFYFVYVKGEYFIKLMDCKKVNANVKDFENKYIKMRISIHDGLWDTNDPNIESRVDPYITYDSIVEIDEPIKIIYNVGNANAYIFTPDQFIYDPVTPIENSSGEYSGGEPKEFKITRNNFNDIFIQAERIVINDKISIQARQMGTGFIKITFKNSEVKGYIDKSPELEAFHDFLHNYIIT